LDIDLYIDTPYKSEEDEEIIKNELNIWAFELFICVSTINFYFIYLPEQILIMEMAVRQH